MSEPKRLQVLKAIQELIAGIDGEPVGNETPKFFRTVKRSQLAVNAEKPACLIKTCDWTDAMRSDGSNIRQKVRLVLAVFVDNQNVDADVVSDTMEVAIGKLQAEIEVNRKLAGLVNRITPLGGAESALEELAVIADTALMYEIEYERPRGTP